MTNTWGWGRVYRSFFLIQLSPERMPWWLLSVINGVTMMGQKIQTNDIHTNTINKHKATMSLKSDFFLFSDL